MKETTAPRGVKWTSRAVWLPAAVLIALILSAALIAHDVDAATMKRANPYRSDDYAAAYLNRTRGGWHYCLNGYYSRREQRLGRHPAGYLRHNRDNPPRFLSFVCATSSGVDVYVLTRPTGTPWVVVRDR